MKKKKIKSADKLISQAYKDPKYAGKHVVAIGGKLYARDKGEERVRLLQELIKKYPEETPLATYIPKADTLILFL